MIWCIPQKYLGARATECSCVCMRVSKHLPLTWTCKDKLTGTPPGPTEPWIRHLDFLIGREKVTANPAFFWDSCIPFSPCNPPLRSGNTACNTASPLTSFSFITCPMQDPGAHQAVLTTRRFKRGTTCSSHIV